MNLRSEINKDSLLNSIALELPQEQRAEFFKELKECNEATTEFILYMGTMSKSSKKELITNYENNHREIYRLKDGFYKVIPKDFIVHLEIDPPHKFFDIPENITLKIYKIADQSNKISTVKIVNMFDSRDSSTNSIAIEKGFKMLNWSKSTLDSIKLLLSKANCISISNEDLTTIGYSYSGLGKYSYKIFKNKLTENEIKQYNDGCIYIYYKDNIVLEYGSGAIGQECFEKD